MTRTAYWGLTLLLVGALVAPAHGQDIKDPKEYDAYMSAFNEKDPAQKAAKAEKFLEEFPQTTARIQSFQFMLLGYAQAGNWAKALETVDKMQTLAPTADDQLKQTAYGIGLLSAQQLKNTAKTREYAEKVLTGNPNDVTALIALSGILASSLPTEEAAKEAQLTRALDVTNRALKQPAPQGVDAAQWRPVQVQLHRTVCQLLLNQKKYDETVAACQEALKIDSKDAGSYYLMGLALKYQIPPLQKDYVAGVDEYNANRAGDPALVAELKARADALLGIAEAKVDEAIAAFAAATVLGGIPESRTELESLYKGKNSDSLEGLDALLATKKTELGI